MQNLMINGSYVENVKRVSLEFNTFGDTPSAVVIRVDEKGNVVQDVYRDLRNILANPNMISFYAK